MKRFLIAVGAGTILLATTFGSASAQTYPPDTTTTTAGQPASTTTTTASTTTTTAQTTPTTQGETTTTNAPPPVSQEATVTDATPTAGEAIVISTPPVNDEASLDTNAPITAGMAKGVGDTDVALVVSVTVDSDGNTHVTVEIPADTPTGLYYVYIVGRTPSGDRRVIIVAIVVTSISKANASQTNGGGGAGVTASFGPAPKPASTPVPAEVKALLASVTPVEVAKIVKAVRAGSVVHIQGQRLILTHRDDSTESSRPLVAAFAVSLVGGSLVAMRRKPGRLATAAR